MYVYTCIHVSTVNSIKLTEEYDFFSVFKKKDWPNIIFFFTTLMNGTMKVRVMHDVKNVKMSRNVPSSSASYVFLFIKKNFKRKLAIFFAITCIFCVGGGHIFHSMQFFAKFSTFFFTCSCMILIIQIKF